MSPLASSKGDDTPLQTQQQLHYQHGRYGGGKQTTYVVGMDQIKGTASGETPPSSNEGEEEDGGVDLGYYQNAYGGVDDRQHQQHGYPQSSQQQQVYHPRQLQPQMRTYLPQTIRGRTRRIFNHHKPTTIAAEAAVAEVEDRESRIARGRVHGRFNARVSFLSIPFSFYRRIFLFRTMNMYS
jgi:hypothetical protein